MMTNSLAMPLVDRFPHLHREIRSLSEMDSDFRQLNDDYELLLRSLADSSLGTGRDREELVSLKTALEAEVLERLSRTIVRRKSHD